MKLMCKSVCISVCVIDTTHFFKQIWSITCGHPSRVWTLPCAYVRINESSSKQGKTIIYMGKYVTGLWKYIFIVHNKY